MGFVTKEELESLLTIQLVFYAVGGLILSKIIWTILFHPLRHVPGPALAKVTDLWHLYYCWGGNRHHKLVALHQKYGPFVRIGPNNISTNSAQAVTAIYSAQAPTLKSDFYHAFAPGFPSSFTTNDKEYKHKKQILSSAFSLRKLEAMEPLIRLHIDKFCHVISRVSSVDIAVMFGALSIDILSDLCFGQSFDILDDEAERNRILEAMEISVRMVIKEGTMHRWPRAIWKVIHSKEDMIKRGYVYQKAIGAMTQQMKAQSNREDFFTSILQARRPDTGEPYDQREIVGEAILLLVAGSDTTSTALTVIMWHLLVNPPAMEKLTREVRDRFNSAAEITYRDLQTLPYLHAVIEEGLRISPPNPGLLPRVVVDRKAASSSVVIENQLFPAGTEIGVCNLSLHRNPAYFDSPDEYIPERWLEGSSSSSLKCNKGAFFPFSYGPRSCLGRNMAYMEMSLTLAIVVYQLDLSFANPEKEKADGFDVEDAFVAIKPSVPVKVTKKTGDPSRMAWPHCPKKGEVLALSYPSGEDESYGPENMEVMNG